MGRGGGTLNKCVKPHEGTKVRKFSDSPCWAQLNLIFGFIFSHHQSHAINFLLFSHAHRARTRYLASLILPRPQKIYRKDTDSARLAVHFDISIVQHFFALLHLFVYTNPPSPTSVCKPRSSDVTLLLLGNNEIRVCFQEEEKNNKVCVCVCSGRGERGVLVVSEAVWNSPKKKKEKKKEQRVSQCRNPRRGKRGRNDVMDIKNACSFLNAELKASRNTNRIRQLESRWHAQGFMEKKKKSTPCYYSCDTSDCFRTCHRRENGWPGGFLESSQVIELVHKMIWHELK